MTTAQKAARRPSTRNCPGCSEPQFLYTWKCEMNDCRNPNPPYQRIYEHRVYVHEANGSIDTETCSGWPE